MKKNKKTFWIITSPLKKSLDIAKKIETKLIKNKFEKNKDKPEFLLIVGGDGTFVNVLRDYYFVDTNVICINTGTLGFYANFNAKNISSLEKKMKEKKNFIKPWILEATINDVQIIYAINEIVVSSLSTMTTKIKINNCFYQKFKGSGIVLSTKTGTTGYCKSLGGALIMPDLNAYEMVEIAPTVHAKNVTLRSPIILSSEATINFSEVVSSQPTWIIADGMSSAQIEKNDKIECRLIKPMFSLFFPGTNEEYIRKIQKAFIKGK